MKSTAARLPQQQTGRETNFTYSETYDSLKTAHTAFKDITKRLLTVNNWHEYTGTGSAKFMLCNNLGDELFGFAAEGFYISIDLPGPGPDAGEGLEWVIVEKLETNGDAKTAEEYLTITVRPVPDPKKANPEIAHFYTDVSTSTFIIRRDGRTVSAGAYGRNEVPNNQDVDLYDRIRNTAIGLMARVGLSGVQWQRLVEGLITYKNK